VQLRGVREFNSGVAGAWRRGYAAKGVAEVKGYGVDAWLRGYAAQGFAGD